MSSIAYYITGHGYGHAVRSNLVIQALLHAASVLKIFVRTTAPQWLFQGQAARVVYSSQALDVGILQRDSLEMDLKETLGACRALHAKIPLLIKEEVEFIKKHGICLIVGDIPPLAFAVGASAGIASIGLGNFTWDWVYADYQRVRLAPSLLPAIRGAYSKASMALRLPMWGGFESFSNVKDIPFVARHASKSREEVVKILKLPTEKPFVLSSFGGYGVQSLDTEALSKFKKYTVLQTAQVPMSRARSAAALTERKGSLVIINEEGMYDAGVRYEDLVGASEAVISKPGYGVISEAIANDAALLYTSRGHFPEYEVLVEEMPKYVRNAFITQDDLFSGKWEPHIDKLLAQPKIKKKPETNGADVAAEILLKALDKPPKKPRGRPKAKF